MKVTKLNTCPVIILLSQISKRWILLILYNIGSGQKYFSQLKNSLSSISSRTLSLRLQDLQKDGFVNRDIVSEQPIRIEYTLTKKGISFKKELDKLCEWGREWN